jgi:hypothetical protein
VFLPTLNQSLDRDVVEIKTFIFLVKKFLILYGTLRFNIMCTKARHWSLY